MASGILNFSCMRDCKQFQSDGINLSLTSNEAAKYFDALLFQIYGFYEAPEVGGKEETIQKIKNLDPYFPLVNLFEIEINGSDKTELQDLKLRLDSQLNGNFKERKWTNYEIDHVKAFLMNCNGYADLAAEMWSDLVALNYNDIYALKNYNLLKILTGKSEDIEILSGYMRKKMDKQNVFYPFILGYEAFGLQERGRFKEAISLCDESLAMYRWNSWATHTLSHVYDAQEMWQVGLTKLEDSRDSWMQVGTELTCHNIWHEALMHLGFGDTQGALSIWDREIWHRLKNGYDDKKLSMFQMSDAVSLLSRIELEERPTRKKLFELDLSERWSMLETTLCDIWSNSTGITFYDVHLALAILGCQKPHILKELKKTCQDNDKHDVLNLDFAQEGFLKMFSLDEPDSCFVTRQKRLIPLIDSISCYMEGDYQGCINILYPLRDKLRCLGGSRAQNDIVTQLLCSALLGSGSREDLERLQMILHVKDRRPRLSTPASPSILPSNANDDINQSTYNVRANYSSRMIHRLYEAHTS